MLESASTMSAENAPKIATALPERLTVSVLDWREWAIDTTLSPLEEGILSSLQHSVPGASIELADTSRVHELFASHLAMIPVPESSTHRHVTTVIARGGLEANAAFHGIFSKFTAEHPLWDKVHVRIFYPNPKDPKLLEFYAAGGAYVPTIPPAKQTNPVDQDGIES